jgi:Transposase domain (DUF772)
LNPPQKYFEIHGLGERQRKYRSAIRLIILIRPGRSVRRCDAAFQQFLKIIWRGRSTAALDLSWLRSELGPRYSLMERPSIDPELMIRMLIVGYVFAIRSERLICREVQVNFLLRSTRRR